MIVSVLKSEDTQYQYDNDEHDAKWWQLILYVLVGADEIVVSEVLLQNDDDMVDGLILQKNAIEVILDEMVEVEVDEPELELRVLDVVLVLDADELEYLDNEIIEVLQLQGQDDLEVDDGVRLDVQQQQIMVEGHDDADSIVILVENDIGMLHEVEVDSKAGRLQVCVEVEHEGLDVIMVVQLLHIEADEVELE